MMKDHDEFLNLRVNLLTEGLARSDKKEIDRMIKKAVIASENKQKKSLEKFVSSEMSSNKVKKRIAELVEKEVAAGLKTKDNRDLIVDVTKRVLVKLYRELAYNYSPVIDRIKL
jgi:hypothetical protein